MKILFNNEPFEGRYYCGVNKYYGILFNNLSKSQEVLAPAYIANPFVDKNKFPESVFFQNETFYQNGKQKKFLTFLRKLFSYKKILARLINKNKKLFLQRIKKNDFDILHIDFCECPSPKITDRIIKYVSKPIVLTLHDVIANFRIPANKDYPIRAIFSENQKKLLNAATKIIAISHNTKHDLVNFLNIPEEKITVIHNCYEKVAAAPHKIELPKKYILYVGKRHDHKNFSLFLNAIREILLEDEELKLVFTLVNFNDHECAYIGALGLLDSCVFADASDERNLAHLYQNALCCVVPSLYEGFGMITLEAMTYGCPAIISDLPIMREVAENAAQYFNPLEQNSIYEAVKKVIDDSSLRQEMIKKGFERSKNFSCEKMISELKQAYSSLAS